MRLLLPPISFAAANCPCVLPTLCDSELHELQAAGVEMLLEAVRAYAQVRK